MIILRTATTWTARLPRGEWIEAWSGARVSGGRVVDAPAPLHATPLWVRAGAILVTYPAAHVARGLGDTPEGERPLVATLWGEPHGGRALARLADATRIACRRPVERAGRARRRVQDAAGRRAVTR